MTRISGRRLQVTQRSLGRRSTRACTPSVSWGSQCGPKIGAPGCQCLEHATALCPFGPRKRPWDTAFGSHAARADQPESFDSSQPCIKYNRYNGDCRFGKTCRFRHVCKRRLEPHPVSKCKNGDKSGDK